MLAIHLHPVNIATFCAFLLRGPERQSRAWNLVSSLRRSPGGLKFSSHEGNHQDAWIGNQQNNWKMILCFYEWLQLVEDHRFRFWRISTQGGYIICGDSAAPGRPRQVANCSAMPFVAPRRCALVVANDGDRGRSSKPTLAFRLTGFWLIFWHDCMTCDPCDLSETFPKFLSPWKASRAWVEHSESSAMFWNPDLHGAIWPQITVIRRDWRRVSSKFLELPCRFVMSHDYICTVPNAQFHGWNHCFLIRQGALFIL